MSLRHLMLAAGVALAAAVAGAPVDAVAAPPGSKNFTPPGYVPNYFSGEAPSFQGNAATQPVQPGASQPRVGPGFAAPQSTVAAASRGLGRRHAVRAAQGRGRLRLAHGRATAHRQLVDARAGHAGTGRARVATSARAPGPRVAQARHGPATSKAVAARSRPAPGKGRSAARGHG
jgi:hypothetical protein